MITCEISQWSILKIRNKLFNQFHEDVNCFSYN